MRRKLHIVTNYNLLFFNKMSLDHYANNLIHLFLLDNKNEIIR